MLSDPNFGFPSYTTPSLGCGFASTSLYPRSSQPSRGKMKCPANGVPLDFGNLPHSPRERLDSPTRTLRPDDFHPGSRLGGGRGGLAARAGGGEGPAALSC